MADLPGIAPFILGLDIGTNSIGWALIRKSDSGPQTIERAGVRLFEAGVEGDVEQGKDQSRAAARRDKRLMRRQHWRQAHRQRKLFELLQKYGLLPASAAAEPEARHEALMQLDAELRSHHLPENDEAAQHLLPYRLRAKALDQPLHAHALGRALYHLAQRRGFNSNRRQGRPDEDDGPVKLDINQLQQEMTVASVRTLGEYLAGLDPEQERVRRRWTSRQMYQDEFDAIWRAQAPHHKQLTDAARRQIEHAIFFQRPLKSQKHLIGTCELEPPRRRAAVALPLAQEFRLLQRVNDLLIHQPDGQIRALSPEEREQIIQRLQDHGDQTFGKLRQRLKLPKGTKFNLEEGGEKSLPGNRTRAAMLEVFGEQWDQLPEPEQERIVHETLHFQKRHALLRRAQQTWGLNAEAAEKLADTQLEEGHASFSRTALARLVPRLREGTPYATARKDEYPESFSAGHAQEHLPSVEKAVDVRNPAVVRALTELRKITNAIVRAYGRPDEIRVELARDLKQPRKIRQRTSRRNRDRQKQREQAVAQILDQYPNQPYSGTDIEKVLLAEECGWQCPYTGRCIEMRTLLGQQPQFDIEHIIPFSRSLDNSFLNKTLCYHEENRSAKGNRTPWQAYSGSPQRYLEILQRVRKFKGDFADAKLERFQLSDEDVAKRFDDFTARHLTDTRYTAKLAAEYLGMLYGDVVDAEGIRRVQVSPGSATRYLRDQWGLNSVLGDGGTKTRDDHRHHAVDAITVALTDYRTVKQLTEAASQAASYPNKLFTQLGEPLPNFLDQAREAVEAITVSHRVDRRIAGPLHAEQFYTAPKHTGNGQPSHHVRKGLHELTSTMLRNDAIVDPVIRGVVRQKWKQLERGDPQKLFKDPANLPLLKKGNGQEVPIRRVRVRASVRPFAIGSGSSTRHVDSAAGSNHHAVISARLDEEGREQQWAYEVVDRFTVHQRRRRNEPIIQGPQNGGWQFKFSLTPTESILMDDDQGQRRLYRVLSVSDDIELRLHHDARPATEIRKLRKQRVRVNGEKLRKRSAQKVMVSPLGDVQPAND